MSSGSLVELFGCDLRVECEMVMLDEYILSLGARLFWKLFYFLWGKNKVQQST